MSSVVHAPSSGGHRIPRRLVIATIGVLPATVFVVGNVLQHGLGVPGAATWMDPAFEFAGLGVLLTAIVIAGPAVAFVLALSSLLPVRFERDDDAWVVRIRIRVDTFAIAVGAISLVVGGILAGHLLAENLACMIGFAERC
jgi:hypothetical protein